MPPRDLKALFTWLANRNEFNRARNNLLISWGPPNKRLLGPDFLPPRLVDNNEDTIDRVAIRGVTAQDGTRHSPAQLIDSGEIFGSVSYKLRPSDLLRQFTGSDYDGVVKYLQQNLTISAAALVMKFFGAATLQGLAFIDEFRTWDAIQKGGYRRHGSNGYYEYAGGLDLAGHRVVAAEDWSDPTVNPWETIETHAKLVATAGGFELDGMRVVTTDQVATILKSNPYTAMLAGKSQLVTNPDGSIKAINTGSILDDADLDRAFATKKLRNVIKNDLRLPVKGGERRVYEEGNMSFIAATGLTEEVRFNQDDPANVRVVNDVVGFTGIGKANGQNTAGRRSTERAFTDQKDARLEFEGWQETGPVILIPEAVGNISGIQ